MFYVQEYFESLTKVLNKIDPASIDSLIGAILATATSNAMIFTCGNGGSASTASHYITDWTKMYNLATGNKFRGLSLCDNQGLITAYANDLSYDQIFSGQLQSLGNEGDLLITVSGSGNSKNIISALKCASDNSITTVAIVGYDGGECTKYADLVVHVPSFDMQICEDIHLMIGHIVMKKICNFKLIT